jgi:hypothetical protein
MAMFQSIKAALSPYPSYFWFLDTVTLNLIYSVGIAKIDSTAKALWDKIPHISLMSQSMVAGSPADLQQARGRALRLSSATSSRCHQRTVRIHHHTLGSDCVGEEIRLEEVYTYATAKTTSLLPILSPTFDSHTEQSIHNPSIADSDHRPRARRAAAPMPPSRHDANTDISSHDIHNGGNICRMNTSLV